jgi:hypothetical protein
MKKKVAKWLSWYFVGIAISLLVALFIVLVVKAPFGTVLADFAMSLFALSAVSIGWFLGSVAINKGIDWLSLWIYKRQQKKRA